jgi:hypothetical protein
MLLARLLVEDPSCHLLAIVLVNLTLTSGDMIRDLLAPVTDDNETKAAELVESLSIALRLASLTRNEYEARIAVVEDCNVEETNIVAHRLALLMAEDQRLRLEQTDHHKFPAMTMTQPSQHLFPETTKWCLLALRNLTRPSTNSEAAHILIRSSILSLILQFIVIVDPSSCSAAGTSIVNAPSSWYSNSIQDTALSIVMNLSACSSSREYMSDTSTIKTLSDIVEFPNLLSSDCDMGDGEQRQMRFQCLKAVSASMSVSPFSVMLFQKDSWCQVLSFNNIYSVLSTEDGTLLFDWISGIFWKISSCASHFKDQYQHDNEFATTHVGT